MSSNWLLGWWQRLGQPQRLALLVGVVGTLVRLSLTGKGTMAFIDEQRYVTAMLGLRALSQGHALEFLQAINSMGARPGDGLWRVIPGLGQAVLMFAFGLNPNAPPSLQVPQVFNVLIISLNALLVYKIYRRFFQAGISLLGVALYSSLANTNLYLRHILPYDHSLFFFLLALWLLLSASERAGLRRFGIAGLLSGFSYAVYPGYFLGPALLLLLGLLLSSKQAAPNNSRVWARWKPVAVQMTALLAILALFELLALASDTSYLASSRYIATTITQGEFSEGFSFIGSYFWQVEGWLGVMLLLLFGVGAVLSLRSHNDEKLHSKQLSSGVLPGLLSIAILLWLGYASAVYFGHQLVFYGRILHFFVPFIVLGSLVVVRSLCHASHSYRNAVPTAAYALAGWHFCAFAWAYHAVEYPADVAYAHGIFDVRQIASKSTTGCEARVIYYRPFGPRIRSQRTAASPAYELVNFAYLYPISCYQVPVVVNKRVVVSVPYFMKYAPYQFEGHSLAQRALLQKYPYTFQIIPSKR